MAPLLGLYGGAAQTGLNKIAKAEKWLGRPVPVMGDCYPRDNWVNVLNTKTWAVSAWKSTPRIKAIGIPLCTEQDLPHYDLAGAATGTYDPKYAAICDGLVGVPNLILRPGWEGNGGWYPWGMYDGTATRTTRAALYATAFQRFVTIARQKLPGVLISWNMSLGYQGAPTPNLYPGDAYVDIVSLDAYNVIWDSTYATKDDGTRFAFLRDTQYGLNWQASFAQNHGKALAWDEWGTGSKPSGQGYDTSKDAPGFIASMAAWAVSKGFLYHTYFNYPAPDGQWQVSPDWATVPGTSNPAKVFPNQQAQFLSTYGVPMSDILTDDTTLMNTDITTFRAAQANLLTAQQAGAAMVQAAQANLATAQAQSSAGVATAQGAVDTARGALTVDGNKFLTDVAAA